MFTSYLDCLCEVFSPMEDDQPLMDAYTAALEEGKHAGFTPVLVNVDESPFGRFIMTPMGGTNRIFRGKMCTVTGDYRCSPLLTRA